MSPEVGQRMAEVGFIPVASTPDAFTAMMTRTFQNGQHC